MVYTVTERQTMEEAAATSKTTSGPTCLYRHFDAEGALLYVGVSLNTLDRLIAHKANSKWFNSIASITIEQFPTQDLALKAEKRAISEENPRYNVVGNKNAITDKTRTTRKILIALPRELARRISYFRYSNEIPSETEAMRTLIQHGLALAAASKPKQEAHQ